MLVSTGSVVTYSVVVRTLAGDLVSHTPEELPVRVLFGTTPIHPDLQAAIDGAAVGDRRRVQVADAFGPHDPGLVREIACADWPADIEPQVGIVVSYTETWETGEVTPFSGTITTVDDDRVVVDGNGALAGQELVFDLHILHVRPATGHETRTGLVWLFPFDVLAERDFPGMAGDAIRELQDLSMTPPYPWGQWRVAELLTGRCAGLAGDLIELGVGLGGMSLFMARMTEGTGRTVYSLDTFAGLPQPDPKRDNTYFVARLYDGKQPLLEAFRRRAEAHGLADRIVAVPGTFAETVPRLPDGVRFCLAHLDSDLYQSVWDSLIGVWDRLVDGGVLIVDDFFHPAQGPARACADFFNERGVQPVYHVIFPYSVAVVKGKVGADRGNRSIDGNTYSLAWLRQDAVFRAAVDAAVERLLPGSRAHENAARMQALLRSQLPRTSDVYGYWLALEDWWDAMATGFREADLI